MYTPVNPIKDLPLIAPVPVHCFSITFFKLQSKQANAREVAIMGLSDRRCLLLFAPRIKTALEMMFAPDI